MSTSIEVDDALVREALERSGLPNGREAVEEGLRLLIKREVYRAADALHGKYPLDLDLEASRRSRFR